MKIISERDFEQHWGAYVSADHNLFEFSEVRHVPIHRVWTVVEGDNGDWIALAGFHIVNRLGYVVTRLPWDNPLQQAYWIEGGTDGDTAED